MPEGGLPALWRLRKPFAAMIKLIAIDLDGTLFNSSHQVSDVNKQAVQRALDAGIQPVIVTGRGRRGVETALDMLALDLPYVCSAGALVCAGRAQDGLRIISARTFDRIAELIPLIDYARRTGVGLIADTPTGNFWFGEDALGDSLDPLTAVYAYESHRSLAPEREFARPLLKITVVAGPESMREVEQLIDTFAPSLQHTFAGMQYLDITARGVDKCSALQIIARHLGVTADESAAIGDQPIDIPMLRCAGVSAAMENAPEPVQAAAQMVVPSNDEDGVAWFIDRLLSGRH